MIDLVSDDLPTRFVSWPIQDIVITVWGTEPWRKKHCWKTQLWPRSQAMKVFHLLSLFRTKAHLLSDMCTQNTHWSFSTIFIHICCVLFLWDNFSPAWHWLLLTISTLCRVLPCEEKWESLSSKCTPACYLFNFIREIIKMLEFTFILISVYNFPFSLWYHTVFFKY